MTFDTKKWGFQQPAIYIRTGKVKPIPAGSSLTKMTEFHLLKRVPPALRATALPVAVLAAMKAVKPKGKLTMEDEYLLTRAMAAVRGWDRGELSKTALAAVKAAVAKAIAEYESEQQVEERPRKKVAAAPKVVIKGKPVGKAAPKRGRPPKAEEPAPKRGRPPKAAAKPLKKKRQAVQQQQESPKSKAAKAKAKLRQQRQAVQQQEQEEPKAKRREAAPVKKARSAPSDMGNWLS